MYICSSEIKRLQLTKHGLRFKANQLSEYTIGLRARNIITVRLRK